MTGNAEITPERIDHIERTAKAAFVLGMNALLKMRDKGVISNEEFNQCVVNAASVSDAVPGTGLFGTLYGFMDHDPAVEHVDLRGIDRSALDRLSHGRFGLHGPG